MGNEKLLKAGFELCYLCSCALHGKQAAKERVEAMDRQYLYRLAKYHYLASITYTALERCKATVNIPPELKKEWESGKLSTIRNSVLYGLEREKIEAFFEKEGIWYLPLKGIILQEMYPEASMRQMCDNDILFDGNFREKLHGFMISQGYSPYMYKIHSHDVYRKAPVFSFEMHVSLFNSTFEEGIKYYENVYERLKTQEGKTYGKSFTAEDFYIFNMAHAFRHTNTGGIGIRTLLDVYVLLSKREESFNDLYVQEELEKLGIGEFEQKVRSLALKLFSKENLEKDIESLLNENEKQLLGLYYEAGVFGTMENFVNTKIAAIDENITLKGKMKYLLRRTFPPMSYYKEHKPFLYKHKYLIPFYLPVRLCIGLFRGKRTFREVKLAMRAKKK